MRPPLSVVVPTKDRARRLETCLTAVAADLVAGDELIAVDSGSVDRAAVATVAAKHGARLIRSEQAGASLARNLGWRAAAHDRVAFIDDDVRVHPGWADAMVAALNVAAVDFVTGGVVVPVGQEGAERPVALTSRTVAASLDKDVDIDVGASANLGVHRAALVAVGGFDERLGPGTWAASAEDLDLFDRLFQAGYLGRFEPTARAEHDQWRGRRELLALDWRYGKGMGVRLAKLRAWDRPRSRRLAQDVLVAQGVRPFVAELRQGYEFGALTIALRTVATVLGMVVGTVRGVA